MKTMKKYTGHSTPTSRFKVRTLMYVVRTRALSYISTFDIDCNRVQMSSSTLDDVRKNTDT